VLVYDQIRCHNEGRSIDVATVPLRNHLLNTETPGKHKQSMAAHISTLMRTFEGCGLGSIQPSPIWPAAKRRSVCEYVAI
jgi:hypothetical protein